MATVSPAENPHRISFGKKATRTITDPSLSVRPHSNETHVHVQGQRPLANRYASQDNGLSPFTGSGYFSPRLKSSSSACIRDVKEVFTIQQILRDTLETRRKPKSADNKVVLQRQHHKKEFLRSWSRERIIVTEEIIYPSTNLTVVSAASSFSSIAGAQSKPYFPLERYNSSTTGKSLPTPSVTLVGALPSHVAEHGRRVPISAIGDGRTSTTQDRRSRLKKQVSEPVGSTMLFSDLSADKDFIGARIIDVQKSPGRSRFTPRKSPQMSGMKHKKNVRFSAATYSLIEHAFEDQLVYVLRLHKFTSDLYVFYAKFHCLKFIFHVMTVTLKSGLVRNHIAMNPGQEI